MRHPLTSFIEKNHDLRYACIIDLIVKRYNPKEKDPFNVKTKLFYKYGNQLDKTWKHIQETTENKIDGLIFTKINHPIVFGRDYSLFKWKEEHTLDFFVKTENKIICLFSQKKNEKVIFKRLVKENEKLIKAFLTKDQLKNGVIVEFKFEIVLI